MSEVANTENINIYESFNLMDVMSKCPYKDEDEALADLKKCFVHCVSVPPVFMIKSYDAIEELPKVSYTSEAVAKQILKKIIIKKIKKNEKCMKIHVNINGRMKMLIVNGLYLMKNNVGVMG